MCAAFELNSRVIRPGKRVGVWRNAQAEQLVWAGFARCEVLGWWKKQGGELVDVPADRFAERSTRDRQLRWDDLPAGFVVRGLVAALNGTPLLKIVTRASTEEELCSFEHPRMPVVEAPLFSAAAIDVELPVDLQGELF
jgi:hypothetical protein